MNRLIFISGWGATARIWSQVAKELDERFPCSFLSWRDGLSGDAAWQRLFEEDTGSALLIGWSLGGLLALQAALAFPQQCSGLVLVGATPRMTSDGAYPGVSPKVLKRMILKLARDRDTVLEDFAANALFPCNKVACAKDFTAMAEGFETAELMRGLEFLAETDLRARLHEIAVPVRILHGVCDRIIPVDQASWLHQHLRGSALTLVEEAGHFLPMLHPEKIVREIEMVTRG
jgi:pimeloyl-[acyl-carrier protein] methyl ester esterase